MLIVEKRTKRGIAVSIFNNGSEIRSTEYEVDPIFVNRWSARAMSGEPIEEEKLMAVFEAAKWAASAHNGQPWRFLYALRDSAEWPLFFDLMVEFNQDWARNAAVLIVALSRKTFEHNGKPTLTHSFDTGAACGNLLLQACSMGLVAHPMQGFDYDKAKEVLNVSDEYAVEVMIALGKPCGKSCLPELLQEQESPSSRKLLNEIVFEGTWSSE